MRNLIFFLTLFILVSPDTLAYMSHEEIVAQMRGTQKLKPSKRTTSGEPVYYDPVDKVLKKKKKKPNKKTRAKRKQAMGWLRPKPKPSVTPTPSVPEASVTPVPSLVPDPSPTPTEPAPTTPPLPSVTATPTEPPIDVSPTPTATPVPGTGTDRRKCDTYVKSQGSTPRCTAYGTAAGIENMKCDNVSLSASHVWSFYKQSYSASAAKYVPGEWITTWKSWPSNNSNPYTGYKTEAKVKITKTTYINGKTLEDDLLLVKKAIDNGQSVQLGMSVPSDMASCYSVIRGTSKVTSGGHHIAVSGYKLDKSLGAGMYLIIKNSWGDDCGDAGYQYLDPMFCGKSNAYCDFYRMEAIEKR